MDESTFPPLPLWTARILGTASFIHRVPSRKTGIPVQLQRPDWKKAMRAFARTGHLQLHAVPAVRHQVPGRVVVLWDVSGSMSDTIDLYLPWLYTLRQKWKRLGVFPFATRLADISEALRAPYPVLRQMLARMEHVFAGGTNIGWALQEWIARYGDRWIRSNTVVVVLSDGWDVGVPDDVAKAMHHMRALDARIVWANPWAGTPGFEPKTRTLEAALPYLERIVPAGTVEELLALANV